LWKRKVRRSWNWLQPHSNICGRNWEGEGKANRSWFLSHPPQPVVRKHPGAVEGSAVVEGSSSAEKCSAVEGSGAVERLGAAAKAFPGGKRCPLRD
jgi:hypothetical protein